jgi:hypothetical protein
MYFYTDNDTQLRQLDGGSSYVVTFPKGQLPPVMKGFWSLTMYNPEHVFYPNQLKRYALGTKNKSLRYNPDGSLTIYLGNQSPGADKESNWLPAPSGNFSIWLRAYWPDQAVLDGTWKPPVISRTVARPSRARRHLETTGDQSHSPMILSCPGRYTRSAMSLIGLPGHRGTGRMYGG